MSTRNQIGKSIFFSSTLPATNDKAGFEALTWVELEYPQTLPQFGISHSNIDVEDLKTGFTKGVKGSASGVDSQGSCRIVDSELATNQATFAALCKAAGGDVALKVVTGSGTAGAAATGDPVVYAQGYVHSYQENQATVSAYEGFVYSFKQNEPEITDVHPTVV